MKFLTILAVLLPAVCTAFTASSPRTTSLGRLVASRPQQQQQFHFALPTTALNAATTTTDDDDEDESVQFLENALDNVADVILLTLRVATCSLMIHHGIQKFNNVEGFSVNVVDKYFSFLPGPPTFWTLSAATTQVFGAVLLTVGVLARPVAFSMMMTMLTAVAFHLLKTGSEGWPLGVPPSLSYNYELAAMYVGVLAYFSAAGAGAYSVDTIVLGGELNYYDNLWKKITGNSSEEE